MTSLNGPKANELDTACIAAYDHAVRQGVFTNSEIAEQLSCDAAEVSRIRKVLTDQRLLVCCGLDQPAVPASPELAEAELSAELEADIAERRQRIVMIHRQMRSLTPIYRKHWQAPFPSGGSRLIEDPAEVRRELAAATRKCAQEAFTVQPGGGRSPGTLNEAVARDTAMLERGVSMRILYQHTARASLATRTYVRKVSDVGAEVRTADEIYERLIIFDRAVAFVPQQRKDGGAPGAAIVTDPTIVLFLWNLHDKMWAAARPYDPSEVEYTSTSDEIKTSILRLMATGLKDDVIARRLGMATRTCRRYMAGIMDELGATSRFQAGMRATALGLVKRDPGLPVESGAPD
ncbi:helix-turn-helix transcriptional regulator [Streptomyces iconiensis]|uniref:LuxR C-terminal-related transcriptional regulator n=1 Tax=Streptomyces iconiensis TaxID=1384038 RepID=A0ABT6ZUL8_9ACTN|nr:LuxR C-terminal-related transcriptional regulator [Streptomyces iconiensis]MDJ1132753.1 LuxR C-terminal-related transcriptional regulator [Streptomyces iconiensis]